MKFMDQKGLLEAINQSVINKYTANVISLQATYMRLYKKYSIIENVIVGESKEIAVIEELDRLIKIVSPFMKN